tara:strand:- start:3505 stop:3657 length:153 start_codon:yes stop_codon:yes gene_type:complete
MKVAVEKLYFYEAVRWFRDKEPLTFRAGNAAEMEKRLLWMSDRCTTTSME